MWGLLWEGPCLEVIYEHPAEGLRSVPASQWIFFSCSAVAPQDTVPFLIPTKKDFTLLMNLCLSASGAAGRLETTLVCDFFFSCRNGFAFLKWLVIISIIISHKGSHWPHAFGKKKILYLSNSKVGCMMCPRSSKPRCICVSCASGCDITQRYAFGARLCGISVSPQVVVVVVGVVVVQIPSLHNVSCPLCLSGLRIIYGQSDL